MQLLRNLFPRSMMSCLFAPTQGRTHDAGEWCIHPRSNRGWSGLSNPTVERDATVPGVMNVQSKTVTVFLRPRMRCPGCVMAPFITLEEAAPSHGMRASVLITGRRAVVPCEQYGEQI